MGSMVSVKLLIYLAKIVGHIATLRPQRFMTWFKRIERRVEYSPGMHVYDEHGVDLLPLVRRQVRANDHYQLVQLFIQSGEVFFHGAFITLTEREKEHLRRNGSLRASKGTVW